MKTRLVDQIIESEIDSVPKKFRSFIRIDRNAQHWEQNLRYYAYAYAVAFEELAEIALQYRGGRSYFKIPVFYLCRHSIELALREALQELSSAGFGDTRLSGHNILKLWTTLKKKLHAAGFLTDDEWSERCGQLIKHIHDFDPRGESFRYPASRGGKTFFATNIDINELVKTHFSIRTYCDGIGAMLDLRNN